MSIKAIFPAGVDALTVHGLHQWDYGQTLEISHPELPAMIEVHFAPVGGQDAIVRVVEGTAGVAEVHIPDVLLEQPRPVLAWVYIVGEASGTTMLTVTLPLQARARPAAGGTIPEEISDKYTEAMAAMNEAVAAVRAGDVIVGRATNADYALIAQSALSATVASKATQADKATKADNADNADKAKEADLATAANTANFATGAEYDKNGNKIDTTYASLKDGFTLFTEYAGSNRNTLPDGSYQFKVFVGSYNFYAIVEVDDNRSAAMLGTQGDVYVYQLFVENGAPYVQAYKRTNTDQGSLAGDAVIYYRRIH